MATPNVKPFEERLYYAQTKCQAMLETIEKLCKETVDLTLGNHAVQCQLPQKHKLMLENPGTNPFINPTYWNSFLDKTEANCREMIRLRY